MKTDIVLPLTDPWLTGGMGIKQHIRHACGTDVSDRTSDLVEPGLLLFSSMSIDGQASSAASLKT